MGSQLDDEVSTAGLGTQADTSLEQVDEARDEGLQHGVINVRDALETRLYQGIFEPQCNNVRTYFIPNFDKPKGFPREI